MLAQQLRESWQALPLRPLDSLLSGHCPLVIAPHPDDESLGCGGLLAQCAAAGIAAQVAILTDGSRSHPGSLSHPPQRLAETRRQEATNALGILGLPQSSLHWFGVEDTRLPANGAAADGIATQLAALCAETGCTFILAPWQSDPHCDHEAAAAIAAALGRYLDCPVLNYPVWGWTLPGDAEVPSAISGFRLDISQEVARKQRAIRVHETQYGGVITDSPEGFTLPDALLSVFARAYETFLLP